MNSTKEKQHHLDTLLKEMGSAILAFSGGVDSTYLIHRAHNVLKDQMMAVIVRGSIFPKVESSEALDFVRSQKIQHKILTTDILTLKDFIKNPEDRCFICKMHLFEAISSTAKKLRFNQIIEGSNADDTNDYRPGMKALRILNIRSPLLEVGLTKEEIRVLSKQANLPTWDKPSMACLATRIPYKEEITAAKLTRIEYAEKLLASKGFGQYRVRSHGDLARIEVLPCDVEKIAKADMREYLTSKIKALGFTYVCLDLNGFRSGAMNETLKKQTTE